MRKVAVVILNWNGKIDTLACLQSLQAIDYQYLDVIIVDNGSTDASVEAITAQFPQYLLIETGTNLGFAEGNNVGIRVALQRGAEYVLLLNNDTVVFPTFIESLLAPFSMPQAGIVGGKLLRFNSPSQLDHLGGRWDGRRGVFSLVGLGDDESRWITSCEIDYVCGAAFMVKKEVFEAIGLLESRFFLVWEEADFCFRARAAGFVSMTAPEAKCLHRVSASFIGGKAHTTYFWWRNRLFWIERNCSCQERFKLWIQVLVPEIFHLVKLQLLKQVQLLWAKPAALDKKREFLHKNRAALCGIKDYLFRQFGQGPAWIYKLTR